MSREIKNVKDLNVQMKDFFRSSDSGSQKIAINPHNILWIIDNYTQAANMEASITIVAKLREEALEYISRNINLTDQSVKPIKKLLFDEQVICQRLRVLYAQGGRLTHEGVAIARYGSLPIFETAVDLGLDYNYLTKEKNYPLRTAFVRKRSAIVNYLLKQKDIDLNHIDMNGYNIAQVIVEKGFFQKMEEVWNRVPEQFLIRTQNQEDILQLYSRAAYAIRNMPKKYKQPVEEIIQKIISYYDLSKKPEDMQTINNIVAKNYEYRNVYELYVCYQHDKLQKNLKTHEDKSTHRIIKI